MFNNKIDFLNLKNLSFNDEELSKLFKLAIIFYFLDNSSQNQDTLNILRSNLKSNIDNKNSINNSLSKYKNPILLFENDEHHIFINKVDTIIKTLGIGDLNNVFIEYCYRYNYTNQDLNNAMYIQKIFYSNKVFTKNIFEPKLYERQIYSSYLSYSTDEDNNDLTNFFNLISRIHLKYQNDLDFEKHYEGLFVCKSLYLFSYFSNNNSITSSLLMNHFNKLDEKSYKYTLDQINNYKSNDLNLGGFSVINYHFNSFVNFINNSFVEFQTYNAFNVVLNTKTISNYNFVNNINSFLKKYNTEDSLLFNDKDFLILKLNKLDNINLAVKTDFYKATLKLKNFNDILYNFCQLNASNNDNEHYFLLLENIFKESESPLFLSFIEKVKLENTNNYIPQDNNKTKVNKI